MEWEVIKRLNFDSAKKQINFTDVIVIHTGYVARIAWNRFQIGQVGIALGMAEAQMSAAASRSPEAVNREVLSINVWPLPFR